MFSFGAVAPDGIGSFFGTFVSVAMWWGAVMDRPKIGQTVIVIWYHMVNGVSASLTA